MSKEDLIQLGKDPVHDAQVRAKCKGSGSLKRKMAQQVRRATEKIEQGGGNIDDITILISNPSASAKQIQEMISKASKMCLKPAEFIQLINTAIRKHSAIFGIKADISLKADIDIRLKYESESHKERMIRMKLLEFVGEDLEKTFGYYKRIEIQRIIYGCLKKLDDMDIEGIEAIRSVLFTRAMYLMRTKKLSWKESFIQAQQEIKGENITPICFTKE